MRCDSIRFDCCGSPVWFVVVVDDGPNGRKGEGVGSLALRESRLQYMYILLYKQRICLGFFLFKMLLFFLFFFNLRLRCFSCLPQKKQITNEADSNVYCYFLPAAPAAIQINSPASVTVSVSVTVFVSISSTVTVSVSLFKFQTAVKYAAGSARGAGLPAHTYTNRLLGALSIRAVSQLPHSARATPPHTRPHTRLSAYLGRIKTI